MKKSTLLVLLFLGFHPLFSQKHLGDWSGELKVQGTSLPIIFHISQIGDSLICSMDSPKQNAKGIPTQAEYSADSVLTISLKAIGLKYSGKLDSDSTITGTFEQGGVKIPLNLKKGTEKPKRPQTPQAPFDYDSKDVTFRNKKEGNLLAGTLINPRNKSDFPIVVMITGSGPQNRDSEIFDHKPFLLWADYLAKNGIGSLRLDDRGVGGSERGKAEPTSEDFAGDINSAVNFLDSLKFKNIGLLGHSEGGMIAPMVSSGNKKVKFLVLLAAPGIAIDSMMKIQSYKTAVAAGLSEQQAEDATELNTQFYRFIKEYQGKNLKNDLTTFTNDKLKNQAFTSESQKITATNSYIYTFSNPWFVYFLRYKPDNYLSKVNVPVLAINGDLDVQVSAKENLGGIEKSLKKAKNKQFEIVEFPYLNHLLQTAKTGAVSEYGEIEETISPLVLEKVAKWIKSLKKGK